jgi:nucleoside-diphosphate kinase
MIGPSMNWSQWTVILLKPDCLARRLVEPVLAWVAREVRVTGLRVVRPTEQQVFAHYDDMLGRSAELGVDVPGELRRIYIGKQVAVALGYGAGAAPRVRAMLGDTDPATADPRTIRGHFGDDSLLAARARGQLINNVIHTSDFTDVVPRDFAIWYGSAFAHLLTVPDAAARPRARTPNIHPASRRKP